MGRMLKTVRHKITHALWQQYRQITSDVIAIEQALHNKGINHLPLDHFAIIDLPGIHTGRHVLASLFHELGYIKQGEGYLPEKQNDFMWLAEENCLDVHAGEAQPQVVVADFRLDELPVEIRNIIKKYAACTQAPPLTLIQQLAAKARAHDANACQQLTDIFIRYFSERAWPLPTTNEFFQVHEFNELLAWVLVFGHIPNHFTLSIHLLSSFVNLTDFHQFLCDAVNIPLNQEGGVIKGSKQVGIEQSSTAGRLQKIKLADGEVELPCGFVEFVWRFPLTTQPIQWRDYFTGFVATHANRVIESLYNV